MVALRQTVENREKEVDDHGDDKILEKLCQQIGLLLRLARRRLVKTRLLVVEECSEWFLGLGSQHRHEGQQIECLFDERLVERNDHKHLLDVHLDDCLADDGGAEERPERHQKMTASDTRKIEQWIGNLQQGQMYLINGNIKYGLRFLHLRMLKSQRIPLVPQRTP